VRPDRKARELAESEQVEMRLYEVIYEVLDDVNKALLGMLKPEYEEVVTGDAEVREIFSVPRLGKVAGCYVLNGVITRGSKVRFLREGTIIWKGSIASLRRFKDDVREVREGFECGIGLENFTDLKAGDVIETYEEREIPRSDVVLTPSARLGSDGVGGHHSASLRHPSLADGPGRHQRERSGTRRSSDGAPPPPLRSSLDRGG
jgi:translation initiation factor IF-2